MTSHPPPAAPLQQTVSRLDEMTSPGTRHLLELSALGLVRNAQAQVRTYATTPQFKLYILNQEEAFFGFYPVVQHPVPINGDSLPINDVMGKDATLFHFAADKEDDSMTTEFVAQARLWFDSVWTTISQEYEV